ncbi:MAG: ankyrin repeat domain-containing protein [Planctomycetaceae bacterium]
MCDRHVLLVTLSAIQVITPRVVSMMLLVAFSCASARQRSFLIAGEPVGMSPVHLAVLEEDAVRTGALLATGADANAKNLYGITPLSIACLSGNPELVTLLLNSGADVNLAIAGGETPLMTAARTGRPEVVQQLLAHGADVNAKESQGQMAIHWAAAEGHAAVVSLLIEAGADPSAPLRSGFNPLLFAAREGHREVVKVLLQRGVDLNAFVESRGGGRAPRPGTTALMLAVENAHFELAIDLVKAGVDPNDNRSGFAPLHAVVWVRKPNRGDDPDGDPPPYGSGMLTSLEFVRRLVALGADVNKPVGKTGRSAGRLNKSGATAFLLAADTADVPLMRTLVELGADTNVTNVGGTTALLAAAGVGTFAPGEEAGTEPEVKEAILYALELGGDINAVDSNGETVMHGAAYKGIASIVELLVERGARIEVWNRENKYGWTPLAIAEGYRHGNFRPLADMVAAIEKAMRDQGVEPVPHVKRAG